MRGEWPVRPRAQAPAKVSGGPAAKVLGGALPSELPLRARFLNQIKVRVSSKDSEIFMVNWHKASNTSKVPKGQCQGDLKSPALRPNSRGHLSPGPGLSEQRLVQERGLLAGVLPCAAETAGGGREGTGAGDRSSQGTKGPRERRAAGTLRRGKAADLVNKMLGETVCRAWREELRNSMVKMAWTLPGSSETLIHYKPAQPRGPHSTHATPWGHQACSGPPLSLCSKQCRAGVGGVCVCGRGGWGAGFFFS